jgi:DNA-binding GntR family transcriptional regulator
LVTTSHTTEQAIDLLRELSLATLAQSELERRIVSDEIPAGTKLNEADVANTLGISRGPVREAFRGLRQAGLVRVEKNRGVFVREVSLEEANEFYEVRAALEGLIGKLAARHIQSTEITYLRGIVTKMRAGDRSRNAEAYFSLNVDFHAALASATRNQALQANYRSIVQQLDLYRRATITRSTDNIPLSTQEHAAIIDAVASGDEMLSERLMTEHVLSSRTRLHAALRSGASQSKVAS